MVGYITPEYREPKPPEGWPLGKMKLFYDQKFRMQCFIFLKYRKKWTRKMIKKYLFINTEETYYKYDHKAKDIINEAYK